VVAPTASVAIVSEFDEVDGAVMFAGPQALDHSVLVRINLDKCAGPDQRIKCVVLSPDVSIKNIVCSGVLREKKRHFTQALEHPTNKVCPLKQNFVLQFHGGGDDRLHLRNGARAEVSVRERDQASLMVQITDVKPEERQDFGDVASVDETQTVEFREAGFGPPILEVAHPVVRHKVSRILLFLYNSPAESLDIADGQMPLLAFDAETFTGFGT
jgi:hypothetical protein